MKKTQFKDALRNIWRQKVSFLSILIIVMLAVMAYLGINFASRALAKNGNQFYGDARYRDIEIISTRLLTEEDLAAIRATEGVAAAEGVWQTSGKLLFGSGNTAVNVVSVTNRVNLAELLTGRLPETAEECALEQTVAEELGAKAGDTVSVQSLNGGTAEFLGRSEFTVTGILFYPDHSCWPVLVPGSREVLVLQEAFDLGEKLQGCYMKAELLLDRAEGMDRFDSQYLTYVHGVKDRLEALSQERVSLRDAEIHALYEREIDENQKRIDEAAKELRDARETLDDGAAQLLENQKKLEDAERTLIETRTKLSAGEIELSEARTTLENTKKELDQAAAQLAYGKSVLDDKEEELAAARQELDTAAAELAQGEAELKENAAKLEDARVQLEEGEQTLSAAKQELEDGAVKISEGKQALAAAEESLYIADAKIAAGQAQLDAAEAQLLSGYGQIEDSKEEIRSAIRSKLQTALVTAGASAADAAAAVSAIPWAGKNSSPALGDPSLSAAQFQLTNSIGISLSKVSYAETIATAMSRFDGLFDLAMTELQNAGIDTTTIQTQKETARAQLQTGLDAATALESSYNANVGMLQAWDDGYADYLDGAATLSAGRAQYNAGLAQYYTGQAELAREKTRLEEGRLQYEEGLAKYETSKQEYEDGVAAFAEGQARYEDGLAKYTDGEAQYAEGLTQFNEGKARYEASLAQYNNAYRQYLNGLAKYEEGFVEYTNGLAQYSDGLNLYNAGKQELDEGRETLAEKEEQYADGQRRYDQGFEQLESAREEMRSLSPTRWVILDVEGNPSYLAVRNAIRNVGDMGVTFALVFVLVGALVVYATVGRIVDEQRRQVGATKALGLYSREILLKYLCFGVTAALVGAVAGTALGYFVIQRILLASYGRFYVFSATQGAFLPGMTLVVLLMAIALTGLTVGSSCTELLRSTAISLMQEKAPSSKYRSKGARGLPLYWRLVLLNMRTDKKRVAVTVVSVAGCCTLLVAGYSMRVSVLSSLDRQFAEIAIYDASITWEPGTNPEAGAEIEKALSDVGADWIALYDRNVSCSAKGALKSLELFCAPLSELDGYYVRRDVKTGALLGDADGVWISKGTSNKLGLRTGEEIILYDAAMNPYPAHVSGVFNMYVGREMILSPEGYASIFGETAKNNAFLLHLNGADAEALRARLAEIPGFVELAEIAQLRATYQSYAGILNLIAGVLTLIAGLMAYFILLNLASMYVNQKKRELTIMRVNGFTVKEVIRYVAGESIATTVLGIVLGLVLGTLLADRVLSLLENDSLQFVHGIQWSGWIFGVLVTVLFSLVIYAVALRKVKYLKLTDVA